MPKDLELFEGLTALWIENDDNTHFFVNIDNKKTWTEYSISESKVKKSESKEYGFYMFKGSNLILQSIDDPEFYVILTSKGFASGSREDIFDSNTEMVDGFWHTEPTFPNGKFLT